jgi:hypothetical protein
LQDICAGDDARCGDESPAYPQTEFSAACKAHDDCRTFMPGMMLAAAMYPRPTLKPSFPQALKVLRIASAKAHDQCHVYFPER